MATPTLHYFVYVIRHRAGILYTGIAKDVDARCAQHNDGCGARFTRGRGPWAVVHQEGPFSHGDALRRELSVKADRRLKAVIKAQWTNGSAARVSR
jgi:putative endonuclease